MKDFERVVIGVVEIGAAAGEDPFVALVLPEHVHALGFELGHRRIVGVAIDHEGVVNVFGKPSAAGVAAEYDIVGAGFEEHEMRILLRHLGHELEAENVGVEGATTSEVAHRNRHMQNAFGLDHGKPSLTATVYAHTRKIFHRQLGENLTHVQANIPRAQYLAEPADNLRLIKKTLRMLHGMFSCRSRSMTRGELW